MEELTNRILKQSEKEEQRLENDDGNNNDIDENVRHICLRERLKAQKTFSVKSPLNEIKEDKCDTYVQIQKRSDGTEGPETSKMTVTINSAGRTYNRETLQSSAVKHRGKPLCSVINSSLDDSVFYSNSHEELLEITRGICRDYICFRLKRNGFRGKVVITKYEPAKDQNLSYEILKIGQYFEDLYPRMFRNLARQLGYVIKSQHELRHLFYRLGTNIIGDSPDEYTWGRTLALFGIAGALSVDCMSQGHCELIEEMVTIFGEFIETHLLTWIVERGGWGGLAREFRDCSSANGNAIDFFNISSCNCTKILSFAGLMVVTVFGTVIAYASLSGQDFYNMLSRNL